MSLRRSDVSAVIGVLTCVTAIYCAPAVLLAQDSIRVTLGSRARLEAVSFPRLTGELLSIDAEKIRIQQCSACTPVAVPTHSITSLELSAGTYVSGKHVLGGALLGLTLGSAYGLVLAERGLHGCRDGPCGLVVLDVPVLGVGGALLGALGGGLWRAERWVRVPFR